ncbi:hypothetical protein KV112_05325 [Mycolicibacter sp. MYC123]|uniref:Low molecular weight antigen MTB12-like C-terminal domain-containing protein n=1 Tax=[Mycobacterium] zoologicum TaxID=2872311 RepID=A0ABU5YH32_9MYCO|nr:hypothetical protein [Mycolicibacter sp. MYC123]MEB3049170.1 hypothetical protein [Mycolicibacter sp. MYC123]
MNLKLITAGMAVAAGIGAAVGGTLVVAVPAFATPGVPAPLDPAPPAQPVPSGAALPTTGEVAGMLTRLSDAGIGYKEKGDLVGNGITQEEGHGLDHELRKAYRDGELPYDFNVLNVVSTGDGQALANVTIAGPKMPAPQTVPLKLVDQGSWVLSHDSATQLMQVLSQG